MAVATAIIGVTALAGLGLSIKQQIDATKAQERAEKAAQSAIAGLKELEYTDKFGDMQVPTLGAELEFEQQQIAMKTGIEALRQEGPSGAFGVTDLERQRSKEALHTAARLEQQEAALELERKRAKQRAHELNVGLQVGALTGEATGAGQAAADAFAANQAAQASMVGTLGELSGVALESSGLYGEEGEAKRAERQRRRKSKRAGRRLGRTAGGGTGDYDYYGGDPVPTRIA